MHTTVTPVHAGAAGEEAPYVIQILGRAGLMQQAINSKGLYRCELVMQFAHEHLKTIQLAEKILNRVSFAWLVCHLVLVANPLSDCKLYLDVCRSPKWHTQICQSRPCWLPHSSSAGMATMISHSTRPGNPAYIQTLTHSSPTIQLYESAPSSCGDPLNLPVCSAPFTVQITKVLLVHCMAFSAAAHTGQAATRDAQSLRQAATP